VLHSPILRTLLLIGIIPSLIGLAYQTFLPVLAQDVFGHGEANAGGLGLLMTISGVGAVLGSLAVAMTADYPRRIRLQLFAGLGFGISLAAFALQQNLLIAMVPLVLVGFMSDYFASINSTIIMSATDPQYYGRVQSVGFAMFALTPIGTLPLGLLADAIGHVTLGPVHAIGVQVTLFLAGIIIVAFMASISALGRGYTQTEQKDLKRFAVVAAERMAQD
jgi:MFS family permease